MKLAFTIVILACWSKLSIASDEYIAPEFVDHVDETELHCHNNILSINFRDAVIARIGPDFISSYLITCLDLSNNQIEYIAYRAFEKLPRLTELYLSNNIFPDAQSIFTFGTHETLEVFVSNNAVNTLNSFSITIPGSYPNLEILSLRNNRIYNVTSITETPFPKLKTLDLSGNNIEDTHFVNLLPTSLEHLYLQDNLFTTLQSLRNGRNITTLTLDNNKVPYLRYYSNNPTSIGLWLYALHNLRYLSVTRNLIHTVESDTFDNLSDLVYLNLSRNDISSLYPKTFAKLKFLKTLDLSHNQLQEIINISDVTNITTLSLSCNMIQSVPQLAFVQMPKLQMLSLNGNQIAKVDINGFSYLYHLEMLDLSNNKLSSLPEGWANAFSSLQILDLSANQFTSLESLSLSNTLPLVEVYLVLNPLKYLNAGSFGNLPKNVTVDLENRLHESVTRC